MEGIERFNAESQIPDISELEGLSPGDINLASAERLIERLLAQGEVNAMDTKEANEMLDELVKQIGFFKEESLEVPAKLVFAIDELTQLVHGEKQSVRELIAKEHPMSESERLAEEARNELENLTNPN